MYMRVITVHRARSYFYGEILTFDLFLMSHFLLKTHGRILSIEEKGVSGHSLVGSTENKTRDTRS